MTEEEREEVRDLGKRLGKALDLLEDVFACDKGMREDEWVTWCNDNLPFMHSNARLVRTMGYS